MPALLSLIRLCRPTRMLDIRLLPATALFLGLILLLTPSAAAVSPGSEELKDTVQTLAAYGDRSTGTTGNQAAAELIMKQFQALGFQETGSHYFSVPVRTHGKSSMTLPLKNLTASIHPFIANAVSPGTIGASGLKGPLVYVGRGELTAFNDKPIEGAIILMELDSGKHWLHAANLGARALIYVDRRHTPKMYFEEAFELSPVRFPRFWMPLSRLRELFGRFEDTPGGLVAPEIRIVFRNRLAGSRRQKRLLPDSGNRAGIEGRASDHRSLL